jgi:acyl-homoserine lactone acylase PvdQ
VRDKASGVPHVYGTTRDGAMFGLGYVGAEDRLFIIDVLRHTRRGRLSSFAGGSNAAMDAQQWKVAPEQRGRSDPPGRADPEAARRRGEVLRRLNR